MIANHQVLLFRVHCPHCQKITASIQELDEYETNAVDLVVCQWCDGEIRISWRLSVFCFVVDEDGQALVEHKIEGEIWPDYDEDREIEEIDQELEELPFGGNDEDTIPN